MKYTARHIQRFLETGKIDPTLWKNHFPTLLPSKVPTCEECSEFLEKTCAGGGIRLNASLQNYQPKSLQGQEN